MQSSGRRYDTILWVRCEAEVFTHGRYGGKTKQWVRFSGSLGNEMYAGCSVYQNLFI